MLLPIAIVTYCPNPENAKIVKFFDNFTGLHFCFAVFLVNGKGKLILFRYVRCSFSLQLREWLDLSLNHSVPSSLLILSRYFNGSPVNISFEK